MEMPAKISIFLLVSLSLMNGCGDSRRDAFVQSQCGEVATVQQVYDVCETAAMEMYEVMNK